MFNKVKSVCPNDDFTLIVTFENDVIKSYDIKPLFKTWDVFNSLQEIPHLYKQVKTDPGGYGISWNDEIDLSCDELWENGTLQKESKG